MLCRGAAGPLAGGAAHSASTQWLPGIHKQQAGPLPPLPFPLPDAFDAALQHQYSVVTDLRGRIRGSGLDEGRRNQLQVVIQSYFREWLHSSGAIRQVRRCGAHSCRHTKCWVRGWQHDGQTKLQGRRGCRC